MAHGFGHMMTDEISLIKRNGSRVDNISASVQGDTITTFNTSVAIEDGDVYERTLPSRVIERYVILDSGYQKGVAGIPSFYKSKVRKQTAIDPAPQVAPVTYNLIGNNSRINIQSHDQSTNIVDVGSQELFQSLKEIAATIEDLNARQTLCAKIEELNAAQGKSDFIGRYQEFVALAANHMTIFAPFLPALAQMLR